MSLDLQNLIEEDSKKRLTDLHEHMQESLKAINSILVQLQDDEEELQDFIHVLQLFNNELEPNRQMKEDEERAGSAVADGDEKIGME